MESFTEEFINAGAGDDFRKIDDLQKDIPYKIIKFRMKTTAFGPALEAEIEDPDTYTSFYCFFPDRFARKVKGEKNLEELNNANLQFIFKGRKDKIAILEFVKKNK